MHFTLRTFFRRGCASVAFAMGVLLLSLVAPSRAQTFNWGSDVFSSLMDSKGNELDDSFVFELGTFANGFNPDSSNVGSWGQNWQTFDRADYYREFGYFISSVQMTDSGGSNSSFMTPNAPSFEGRTAYLWVRNDVALQPGTEWMLSKVDAWGAFPNASAGCCDNQLPIEWSLSDLALTDTPIWGSQGGVAGDGQATSPGAYSLQTYTVIPEPSSVACVLLAASVLLRRRRESTHY